MKIQVFSDLHLEFSDAAFLPEPMGDVLVLAGDIVTVHGLANVDSKRNRYKSLFQHAAANWRDVIYIAGNHEYYKWRRSSVPAYLRQWTAQWKNVHFMENDRKLIQDVMFVGSTLWTDFFGGQEKYRQHVGSVMNDYADHTYLTTSMTENYHHTAKKYISDTATNNQRVCVVTHHAPSALSCSPVYAGDPANAGYYSNMDEFILQHPSIECWIHGHMHNSSDYLIGSTRVINNARGYPHELNTGFDPMKIIQL